jgi:hypothetical protein
MLQEDNMKYVKWASIIGLLLCSHLLVAWLSSLYTFHRIMKWNADLHQGLFTYGIGKDIDIVVEQGDVVDANTVAAGSNYFAIWNPKDKSAGICITPLIPSDRMVLAEYMRRHDVKLKPGTYRINQITSFPEALTIFSFEPIHPSPAP